MEYGHVDESTALTFAVGMQPEVPNGIIKRRVLRASNNAPISFTRVRLQGIISL